VHQERPLAAPPPLPRERPERWWIASYSRLRRAGEDAQARQAPVSAQEETWLELADSDAPDAANAAEADPASPATLHGFPRGPVPGNFLHAMLEWAARQGFAQALADPGLLDGQLAQVCRPARWTPYRQTLQDWMARWLSAPWDLGRLGATTAVAPVALQRIQPEMEFWVGAREVDAAALDRAVRAHTLGQASRPLLEPERLNGMLKGFIDLVFEHEGRWWVADYKSNWLGPTDAHYTPERMRQEVLLHRYELQYSLYLFALHRLLRSRLPHYDYDLHVGGAVYLFLRGHAAPGGGLHLERPPAALMHALDALFDGQAAKEAA
jgi:exodeoxyribonuclease V beta subunit